eukprot:scaffold5085_cov247-Pinguiococcus_pyrenoidosus.AAC.1
MHEGHVQEEAAAVDGSNSDLETEGSAEDREATGVEYVLTFSPTEEFVPRSRVVLRLPRPAEDHGDELSMARLLVDILDSLVVAFRSRTHGNPKELGYDRVRVSLTKQSRAAVDAAAAPALPLCGCDAFRKVAADEGALGHVMAMMSFLEKYGVFSQERVGEHQAESAASTAR